MVSPPTPCWSAQLAQLEPDALFPCGIDATTPAANHANTDTPEN